MIKAIPASIALLAILVSSSAVRADTHAVVESSRVYMEQETKVTFEYWIASDRNSRRTPARATITRDDLGVVWNIDLNGKTYTESRIGKSEGVPAPRKPDMRKLWLEFYEPDFDWTAKDAGQTETIGGFPCRMFEASGEADFAEINARYWICLAPDTPGGKALHDYSMSQYRGDGRMAALVRLLEDHPAGLCVFREETVEPSIAPTTRVRTGLTRLEEAAAPPGTYDIPDGFKKLESRGDN
jgi:hypothetical protein